jgi:hypothetical protein
LAAAFDYPSQALNELQQHALAEGLLVDSSATHEIYSVFGEAIARAERSEGEEIFSPRRRAEFGDAANRLAVEATRAAQRDHAEFIGSEHISSAADMLR